MATGMKYATAERRWCAHSTSTCFPRKPNRATRCREDDASREENWLTSHCAQPSTVASNPAMPNPSAASASPALRAPPTNDAVLMSSGRAAGLSLRMGMLLSALASTPPPANHAEVGRLTKPPNDDAYGDGSNAESSTKSVANPTLVVSTNFLYAARDLMTLRSTSVTRPIATPIQMAVR